MLTLQWSSMVSMHFMQNRLIEKQKMKFIVMSLVFAIL